MRQDTPPPSDEYVDVRNVPTPQTDRYKVISRSSRFWFYVYNDPKYRLLLASAVIVSIYFIIKVVDAISLYGQISELVAMSTAPELQREYTTKWFFMELPIVHYIAITLALVFNWLAWLLRRPWCALAAGVCYLVSIIAYIRWAIYLIPSLLLITVCYMSLVRKRNAWL